MMGIPAGLQASAIMADAGWPYATWSPKGQGRSASRHYHTEAIDEIKALPVATYAARDCWLFKWCPCPSTPWLVEVMAAWGFQFSGLGFAWVKTTKRAVITPLAVTAAPGAKSPWHMGLGHTTRKNIELCWLGRRGNPPRLSAKVHDLIVAPVRGIPENPTRFMPGSSCSAPVLILSCSRASSGPGGPASATNPRSFRQKRHEYAQ